MTMELTEEDKLEVRESVLSPIEYLYDYTSEFTKETTEFVFRFMNYKELKEWTNVISPNSSIHAADKPTEVQRLLSMIVVSHTPEEFIEWMDQIFEVEVEAFIFGFTEAKEKKRKK